MRGQPGSQCECQGLGGLWGCVGWEGGQALTQEAPARSLRGVSPRMANGHHAGYTECPGPGGRSPSGHGTRLSHRRGKVAAAALAERRGLQPSSDQAGRVHGFLSFPFCKMRIPTSPGCLGDTAKRVTPHCPRGVNGKVGGGRAPAALQLGAVWGCCSLP